VSVNKNLPHLLVLPEDGANRQIANGFALEESVLTRRMQILAEASGWEDVVRQFKTDHVLDMERYRHRFLILLVDFDNRFESRLEQVRAAIPEHLMDRVFVIGALSEPENLKKARLGSYESIGLALAKDCSDDTTGVWGHELLVHNGPELVRLRQTVRPFLFSK
jgi:hypothetical protein